MKHLLALTFIFSISATAEPRAPQCPDINGSYKELKEGTLSTITVLPGQQAPVYLIRGPFGIDTPTIIADGKFHESASMGTSFMLKCARRSLTIVGREANSKIETSMVITQITQDGDLSVKLYRGKKLIGQTTLEREEDQTAWIGH